MAIFSEGKMLFRLNLSQILAFDQKLLSSKEVVFPLQGSHFAFIVFSVKLVLTAVFLIFKAIT